MASDRIVAELARLPVLAVNLAKLGDVVEQVARAGADDATRQLAKTRYRDLQDQMIAQFASLAAAADQEARS